MRVLVMSTLLLIVGSASGHAQTYDPSYPVCMKVYEGSRGGERLDCRYTSLPQCRASASGRPAMCEINPYFAQAQSRPRGPYQNFRGRY